MTKEQNPFPGFTEVAESLLFSQEWMEISTRIDHLAELKVILYTLAHTSAALNPAEFEGVTIDEIVHGRRDGAWEDRGIGLSKTAARGGLARAIHHGYLVMSDESQRYRIKFAPEPAQEVQPS